MGEPLLGAVAVSGAAAAGAFTLFVTLAMPVCAIWDFTDGSNPTNSPARYIDLSADGLNAVGTCIEFREIYRLFNLGEGESLTTAEILDIVTAIIIVLAIFVVTYLEKYDKQIRQNQDTNTQPSSDPVTGGEFRKSSSNFEDISYDILRLATPGGGGEWSGIAADWMADRVAAQRLRMQHLAQADVSVADTVQTQADQVRNARMLVAAAKLTLSAAIPGAVALYQISPWGSVLWQITCGAAAISQVVTAYEQLHEKSQDNADALNEVTARYTRIQQSALLAVTERSALTAAAAAVPPPTAAAPDSGAAKISAPASAFAQSNSLTYSRPKISAQQQIATSAPFAALSGSAFGQTPGPRGQHLGSASRRKAAADNIAPTSDTAGARAGAVSRTRHAEGIPAELTVAGSAEVIAQQASEVSAVSAPAPAVERA